MQIGTAPDGLSRVAKLKVASLSGLRLRSALGERAAEH